MNAGKLLAGALLAGVGIATGEVTLVATAAGVGVNWLADELPLLWPALGAHGKANSLAAAYAAAIRQGSKRLEADYRRTIDPRGDLAAFRLVAACADSVGEAEFPAGVSNIDSARQALADALGPLLYGHDERQATYLREHLLEACTVAFQEQLVQNEAAWRAFHDLLLRGLAANSTALLAQMEGFTAVLAAWSDPTAGLEALRAELARHPTSAGPIFDNRGLAVEGNVYQAERQYFGSAHAEGGGTAIVTNTFGAPPPPAPRPVTILFLAANPDDTLRLHLDREMRAIEEQVGRSAAGNRFAVAQVWAARRDDIVAGLQNHKPDIVHFAGHASEDGRLLVENAGGLSEALTPGDLRVFLAAVPGVRCVVLNACWSDALAGQLVQAVDCVAGMPIEVSDGAAIRFAAWFYGSLANGLSVPQAFDVATVQMQPVFGTQGMSDAQRPRLRVRPGVNAAAIRFS